jgi:hypothetical protein
VQRCGVVADLLLSIAREIAFSCRLYVPFALSEGWDPFSAFAFG